MISLALKYLAARKRQSLFTLFGIFLGAAGFVTISGFFFGFENYLVDQLVNNSAHIFIQARQEFLEPHTLDKAFFGDLTSHVAWAAVPSGRKDYARIEDPHKWYDRLIADPRVMIYSPQMNVAALISKAKTSVSAKLIGCLPEYQVGVNTISSRMVEGEFSDIGAGGYRIVVGRELLRELGATVSQNVMVAVGPNPPIPFKIVGVFDSGNKDSDLQAFAALADVQKANHALNQINEIDVKLQDFNVAAKISTTWGGLSPEKVESWDQRNANIFSIFATQNALRFLVVGVVMLIAGFGIYNVLTMTVTQKLRDIAILKAMGYENFEIQLLFLYQGLILGIAGALSGSVLGYCACLYLKTLTIQGPQLKTAEHLHVALSNGIFMQAALLSILSATLASFLPARSAGKLTPIEIIRGGTD